jgi:ATP-dependent HslUV protease, peptidase subunit HslV
VPARCIKYTLPVNHGTTRGTPHGTTVLAVRRDDKTALAADGQVTLGDTVVKHGAKKLRRLSNGEVLAGFAGTTADAQALFTKFEGKLQEYHGNLERAAVELAKDWRTDRVLRRLDALLLVADAEHVFLLSGNGDLIEPDDGIIAIGSGGPYALAAARALVANTKLTAAEIAKQAMQITAGICIYTNSEIALEEI